MGYRCLYISESVKPGYILLTTGKTNQH